MRLARSSRSRTAETSRRLLLACISAALFVLVIAPGAGAAAAGVDITAVEGQSFTGNVVDGLSCPLASAAITWGDGTPSTAGASDGSTGIQGTHTYADEGSYSGSVSYTYQPFRTCPTGTQTASFQATVQDAPLTAAGANVSGTVGQPLSGIVAHFSDANPAAGAAEFSAQINWGDGARTFGTVAAAPTGGFDVSGTHTYSAAGSYPVSITITDIGGSSASANSAAQIAAAPPPPPPPPRVVPSTVIVAGPIGVTSDLEPGFGFTSTITGSTFQCALDPGLRGTRWSACTSPHFTPRLAAGKHLFEVRAISPAGVTDPTGATRGFEVQPAANTEDRSCLTDTWVNEERIGSGPPFNVVGSPVVLIKNDMSCSLQFACPQWYDCVLSGTLTFSFSYSGTADNGYTFLGDTFGLLTVGDGLSVAPVSGPCIDASNDGQPLQYDQLFKAYYCSQTHQITFHGASDSVNSDAPYVRCYAGSSDFFDYFDYAVLGCAATIRRTWAPGSAHSHPVINLVRLRRTGDVLSSSRTPVWTGATASCGARGGACAVDVTAVLASSITGAHAASIQPPPHPPAARSSHPQLIGVASLKVRPGKRVKVTFKLTRQGAALLHKRHRLQVELTITTPPARLHGHDSVIKRTLTIVAHR